MNSFGKIMSLSFLVANNYGGALSSVNSQIMRLYQQKAFIPFEFTQLVNSIVTVSIIVGFMIGSMIASPLTKKFSNRMIGAVSSFVSLGLNFACAIPVHWIYMAIMRLLLGASITTVTTIIPGWLSDLAVSSQRSILSSTYQFFLCLGIFLSSTVMLVIKDDPAKYWLTFIYDAVSNLLCAIVCLLIKAPTSSIAQNQDRSMIEDVKSVRQRALTMSSPELKRAKLTMIFLAIGSQVNGINVVMMYATGIFEKLFNSPLSPIFGALLAGAVNAFGTLPPLPFVSKVGRKKLLFGGWFVMNAGHLILIAAYLFNLQQLIIVGSVIFLLGFEFGPGAMMVVVLGEVNPRQFKQQLNGMAYSIMWVVNIGVVLTFPFFEKVVWAAYSLYFIISFVCGLVLMKLMPETLGKSFEQIESEVMRIDVKKNVKSPIQVKPTQYKNKLSLLDTETNWQTAVGVRDDSDKLGDE
ncbi:Hexose_transporter [Hexamita inflata]|uniref:Hexose_transporter n=1 Tax=Hexamita inflata TaxID=28002 RepID=A0ABP1I660_9EUKA